MSEGILVIHIMVAIENLADPTPRARIVCLESYRHVIARVAYVHCISYDWINIVRSIIPGTLYDPEIVLEEQLFF